MYQYFDGLVIREGTEGIPAEKVEKLFEDAGWARNTPDWQKEKFSSYSKIPPGHLLCGTKMK
jgi:hypothetical protein